MKFSLLKCYVFLFAFQYLQPTSRHIPVASPDQPTTPRAPVRPPAPESAWECSPAGAASGPATRASVTTISSAVSRSPGQRAAWRQDRPGRVVSRGEHTHTGHLWCWIVGTNARHRQYSTSFFILSRSSVFSKFT